MEFVTTNKFQKQYRKLDPLIQKKVQKALRLLSRNTRHASLQTKRMHGVEAWEARADYHYRLTFDIVGEYIVLYTVGMHDEGLGKK